LRSVRMTDSCLQTVLRHKHLAGPVEGFVWHPPRLAQPFPLAPPTSPPLLPLLLCRKQEWQSCAEFTITRGVALNGEMGRSHILKNVLLCIGLRVCVTNTFYWRFLSPPCTMLLSDTSRHIEFA
jgi:hypothetical protein